MNNTDKIKQLQAVLGVVADGVWGPKSQSAFDLLISGEHHVKATSFADPVDVAAYRRAIARGMSEEEAKKIGDNGKGVWDDDTTEGSGPSCALPPDDMIEKWGSIDGAKHKLVDVTANYRTVTCVLKDRMPWKKNIENGAGIDLNPDAVRQLGFEPPLGVSAVWKWI